MKTPARKAPAPFVVSKLFSAGTLRRAGLRPQPARPGKGVDSWLVLCFARMAGHRAGYDK
jgi:hypothetical protein